VHSPAGVTRMTGIRIRLRSCHRLAALTSAARAPFLGEVSAGMQGYVAAW